MSFYTTQLTIDVKHNFQVGEFITSNNTHIQEVMAVELGITDAVYLLKRSGSGSQHRLTVGHVDKNFALAPGMKQVVKCTEINTNFDHRNEFSALKKTMYLIELRDGSTVVMGQPFSEYGATFEFFKWRE
jgi:hypothetical protein